MPAALSVSPHSSMNGSYTWPHSSGQAFAEVGWPSAQVWEAVSPEQHCAVMICMCWYCGKAEDGVKRGRAKG